MHAQLVEPEAVLVEARMKQLRVVSAEPHAHPDVLCLDVEVLRAFDVEAEHVWMRMRFGEHYAKLSRGGLDEDRLRLYQLCMHLDLVAGPLRIADTSHPEREWFRSLAEHHLQRALQFPA